MGRILTFESWVLNESSTEQVTEPISPNLVVPESSTPDMVATNKEILDGLKTSGILSTKISSLPSVEDKNFLKSVLVNLESQGEKPILQIPKSTSPSIPKEMKINIPDKNLSFSLKKGYFGTNVALPSGINLKLGYQGSKKNPISASNIRVGIQIPIGT